MLSSTFHAVAGTDPALVSVTEPQYPAPQSLVMARVAETPLVVTACSLMPAESAESDDEAAQPAVRAARRTPRERLLGGRFMVVS